MIIAVSDVHLGCEFEDQPTKREKMFENFLDDIALKDDVDHFVLIGDILDMWRRDPIKLFLIYENLIKNKFRHNTGSGPKVHYIIGNHDFHLIELKEFFQNHYNMKISRDLTLNEAGRDYYFIHGYQYGYYDILKSYEEFADKMSLGDDEIGKNADSMWDMYLTLKKMTSFTKRIFPRLKKMLKRPNVLDFKEALKPAEERFSKDYRSDIEYIENVVQKREDMAGKFVVYGHTHISHCDINKMHANTGTWGGDSTDYIKIDGEKVEVLSYTP